MTKEEKDDKNMEKAMTIHSEIVENEENLNIQKKKLNDIMNNLS